MKKHLLLMLVVAGITFSFLSCSSDDDAPLTSLKGTEWVNNEEKDITKMLNFTTEKDFYYTTRETEKGQTVENQPFVMAAIRAALGFFQCQRHRDDAVKITQFA